MRHVSFDIETFSSVDIGKSGSYKYALSQDFDILLIAYAVDAEPVQIIDLQKREFDDLCLLDEFLELIFAQDTILHAYNAAFEYWCMNIWLKKNYPDLGTLPVHKYSCTMVHGLYCGYTAGLGVTGEVLGLPQDKKKMTVGKALIRKFCVPQKDGKIVTWQDEPEKWDLFKQYCINDVEAEREIERRLSDRPLPVREQKLWELDIITNSFGVGVDMDLVNGALEIRDRRNEALLEEAKRITGLDNPMSVSQLMAWLSGEKDISVDDLRKATVTDLLSEGISDKDAERMLQIRQQLGKTSTKKYDAIVACACDDNRVRGVTQYYGANRTGRYSGRLIQTQNLPQNHLDDIGRIRELVKARDHDMLDILFGEAVNDALSQLIRTAIVPRPGYTYAIADYSAIEARVIAYLAKENWVLDVFRNNGDIYCATASQMFGVPVEKHGQNSGLRQKGKIATLALGYSGGEGALIAMGALKMGLKEDELTDIKTRWRKANPHIVRFWYEVGDAAETCILEGEPVFLQNGIAFRYEQWPEFGQKAMTIQLPSGRKLYYAEPHFKPAKRFPEKLSLHYYGVNQQTKKWEEVDTHGGKLVENIVQAFARDILCETLMKIYKAGYTPSFHVHDEVIIEAQDAEKALSTLLDIMADTPQWAKGLPLKGAGFTTPFYMKD